MLSIANLVYAGVKLDVLGHVGESMAHCVNVQGQVLEQVSNTSLSLTGRHLKVQMHEIFNIHFYHQKQALGH